MTTHDLDSTARALVAPGKGILAADESAGTIKKRFDSIKLAATEENGRRYHHILNPATGRPTEGILTVSVIGPDGTLTDGLDTAIFVLGAEAGLELIARYPDYETIIVESSGKVSYSPGLVEPTR